MIGKYHGITFLGGSWEGALRNPATCLCAGHYRNRRYPENSRLKIAEELKWLMP